MKYAVEMNVKQNKKNAVNILEDYLDKNNNYTIREKLAEHYAELGDINSFISNFKLIIENEPNSISRYYQIASKYYDIQKYTESLENIKKCIEIAPYVGAYYEQLGNTYKELGDNVNARQSYIRCLELNPYNFQVRDKLRILDNKKSMFELFETLNYYKIYNEAPSAEKYPGEFALILLNNVNKIVYTGGASEEKHHYLVKIFTSKGRDIFKEFSVPVMRNQSYIIEKAEVLKKDGSKLKAEVNENNVVFTNLQEGDAVLLVYKLQTFQFGSLSQYFSDNFTFTSFIPYVEKKYELITASDIKFEYKMMNSDIKPEIKKIPDEFTYYNWNKYNQPGVNEESYMPSILDFGEVLYISSLPSWDFISKWYLDISKTKSKSDHETKEVIEKLFPNKSNINRSEIVKTIYNYIVNNIRYSSIPFRQSGIVPQKASKTINTQMGDCKDVATLFVALCNEMNIKATWVLVSTRDNGLSSMPLPSIDFNHCIATVNIDDKKFYVDLTNDDLPFGNIYGLNNNAIALEINENPLTTIFNIAEIEKNNSCFRKTNVTFKNEKMTVEINSLRRGGLAASTRANYKNKSKEEQMKDMSEAIASDYANIKLTSLDFKSGLNDNSDSIEYSYIYNVNRVFNKISNFFAFKIPLTDAYSPIEFLANDERKYPIDLYQFSTSDVKDEILNIIIPDDKVLAEIPETVKINSRFADYLLEFRLEGNTINVHRSFIQKELNVKPSEYKDLQKFYNDVVKADETQIAFKAKK
jgi:tetratricopeptide (TPR) repeat protein